MSQFNQGKSYHGSDAVQRGQLKGATDTDYFYFFCSRCPQDRIVRILDYTIKNDSLENRHNDQLPASAPRSLRSFRIVFKFHCDNCGLTDFFKVSNTGWQDGTHAQALGLAAPR
jgi:hypothetical protein